MGYLWTNDFSAWAAIFQRVQTFVDGESTVEQEDEQASTPASATPSQSSAAIVYTLPQGVTGLRRKDLIKKKFTK